jgi:restriction system protein
MTVWLIRAGKFGEREDFAIEHGIAVIGWDELSDLSAVNSREALSEQMAEKYPDAKAQTRMNWISTVWPFAKEMKPGDLVAMPLKNRGVVLFGEIAGDYQYVPGNPGGHRHARPVRWADVEVPRNQIDPELLSSINSRRTVCRIRVDEAEKRITALLRQGGQDLLTKPTEHEEEELLVDYEQMARDEISSAITRKFKGHGLARLVAAILQAQGYQVRVSPEGPDGGVDIIAGRGPLGFETPRLVVQVKSGKGPVDVNVMRELTGVMTAFGADSGLIVAWGGYRGVVEKENARQFFKIRLWDADMLVKIVQENYERLA